MATARRRRFRREDFKYIADHIAEEYDRRKKSRGHLDRVIKEIDRQVAMIPNKSHKTDPNTGLALAERKWMAEVEPPLQAETLETLVSDADNLLFPKSGPWYGAHADMSDEYLARADLTSFIAGDDEEVESKLTQDDVDNIVRDYGNHLRGQYDFRGNIALINAEAFCYGIGLGRVKVNRKKVYLPTARGIVKQEQKIPTLVPRSVKSTFVDDREHITQQEGWMVGPLEIFWKRVALHDLAMTAKKGSRDPRAENGGWVAANVARLKADDKGLVEVLEAEGDLLIPRKSTDPIYVPNVIVDVAIGKNDREVVRVRFREGPHQSLLRFPYFQEHIGNPYATSPLRKGHPLQAAVADAMMQVSDAAALNVKPPIGYDRNDLFFAERGGPVIEPGAQWGTIGDIKVHQFASTRDMLQYLQLATSFYADVAGMHRARLGAQTVSHTTAFAKNAELQRGSVRTVRYTESTLRGPLTQFLGMEYALGRAAIGRGRAKFYSPHVRGFLDVRQAQLPDDAVFEAHGSGGPAEEREKRELKMAALAQAIEMDGLLMQRQQPPNMNIRQIQERTLYEGGWSDPELFFEASAEDRSQELPMEEEGMPFAGDPLDLIGPIEEPI